MNVMDNKSKFDRFNVVSSSINVWKKLADWTAEYFAEIKYGGNALSMWEETTQMKLLKRPLKQDMLKNCCCFISETPDSELNQLIRMSNMDDLLSLTCIKHQMWGFKNKTTFVLRIVCF